MSTGWGLLVCCAVVVATAAPCNAVGTTVPPHPGRLTISNVSLARITTLLDSGDSGAERRYTALTATARELLSEPVVPPPVEGGPLGILIPTREVLSRVYTLSMIARLTNNETFANRGIVELLSAANWTNWNPENHFLDTAEMMHAQAVGLDSLWGWMTTAQRSTVSDAIAEKGLKPFLNLSSTAWWAQSEYNWNGVCNGGAVVASLGLLDAQPVLAGQALSLALANIESSLGTYAPMGLWPEGPDYQNYETRYVIASVESLANSGMASSATRILQSPGLQTTCDSVIQQVDNMRLLPPFQLRNWAWADSELITGTHPNLHWMSRQFGRLECAYAARRFYDDATGFPNETRLLAADHRVGSSVNAAARELLFYNPDGEAADLQKLNTTVVDRSRGMFVARTDWTTKLSSYLGFKGGDNSIEHNHLDLGSFIYATEEAQWAEDLGKDTYTLPGYFGPQRWSYYRPSTAGHSTVMFGGQNQWPNATASFSSVLVTEAVAGAPIASPLSAAVLDLSAAYAGQVAVGDGSYRRGAAVVYGRRHLIVRDEFGGSASHQLAAGAAAAAAGAATNLTWRFHTRGSIENATAEAVTLLDGPDALLLVRLLTDTQSTQCPGAKWETYPLELQPPQLPATGISVVQLVVPDATTCRHLSVQMMPLQDSDLYYPVTAPLSDWGQQGPLLSV